MHHILDQGPEDYRESYGGKIFRVSVNFLSLKMSKDVCPFHSQNGCNHFVEECSKGNVFPNISPQFFVHSKGNVFPWSCLR